MTDFDDLEFFQDLLNSFKNPVLVADTGHIVRYANRAAEKFYPDGASLLGRSLFDCHNSQSQQQMTEILLQMEQGLEEKLITDNEIQRIYMRAVRSKEGQLLGYYERFEPPAGE
jgi:nitrogen-specific signal transduction histidine kinase